MLFYVSETAGWASFGLILAALIGFISYHYWKKSKGTAKSEGFKPTDDGYENIKFQKHEMEIKNEQLEKEIKETKEKLETKQELEVKLSVLQANYNSLKANHDSLCSELEELRREKASLTNENTKLTQQISEKDNQLKEKGNNLEDRKQKIQNLEKEISTLQNENKKLEIEKQELLTNQTNLEELNKSRVEELRNMKDDWKRLQDVHNTLEKEKAKLEEQKIQLEERTQRLGEQYKQSWDFYESLRNNGLEPNLAMLLQYKEFRTKHLMLVEKWEREEEAKRDRIAAGNDFERSWQEDLEKQFSSEELEFIDIELHPLVEGGKKGDYKVSFRDSKNFSTSENQLHIFVEHKYSSKKENILGEVNAKKDEKMNEDLREARDKASKGDYDFVFLITNREIGQEKFKEKGFYWISTDKDYQFFGLKPPARSSEKDQQVKPAIIIMTREKSFEFLWDFYTLWKNWSSHRVTSETDLLMKKINESFTSPEFKKDLVKWIDSSDEFNLEISEKMEKQWGKLIERMRIISEFWAAKKKQAYKLNRKAMKLRQHVDWAVDENETSEVHTKEPEALISRNLSENAEILFEVEGGIISNIESLKEDYSSTGVFSADESLK